MTTEAQIETDARTIVNCFMSAPDPLPLISASAFGGNGWQENLCRPVTLGPKDHGSDGFLQWRLSRLDELKRRPNWDTLPVQVQFAKDECKRDYPHLWAQLVNPEVLHVPDVLATLTLNICDQFERPSAAGRVPDTRIGYARRIYALMQGQTPPPVPTPVPTPTPETKPVDPTPTPAPAFPSLMPILLQLFEAFGRGVATVLLDRFAPLKSLPIPLPIPMPAPSPTAPAVTSNAVSPSPQMSDLIELFNRVETALNQGKAQ